MADAEPGVPRDNNWDHHRCLHADFIHEPAEPKKLCERKGTSSCKVTFHSGRLDTAGKGSADGRPEQPWSCLPNPPNMQKTF